MTETEVSKRLLKSLRSMAEKPVVYKIHGHAMQQSGIPDFYIACHDVQAWVETKGALTALDPLQRHCISQLREKGVNAYVLRFVLVTKKGKLFTLEDENGNTLWSFGFNTWSESGHSFLSALREVTNGKR